MYSLTSAETTLDYFWFILSEVLPDDLSVVLLGVRLEVHLYLELRLTSPILWFLVFLKFLSFSDYLDDSEDVKKWEKFSNVSAPPPPLVGNIPFLYFIEPFPQHRDETKPDLTLIPDDILVTCMISKAKGGRCNQQFETNQIYR